MSEIFNVKIIMQITITYQANGTQLIDLPEGTQKITRDVFQAINAIEDVSRISIPDGILTIGNDAFRNCTNLSFIDLPSSLTHIGNYAFANCTSLLSIALPPSLTHIGKGAFGVCTNLSSISLPPFLTHIDVGVFIGCTSLSSISLPPSLQILGNCAFAQCTSLTSIAIPPSLTHIGKGPFYGCTSLKTILTSQALNQDIRATLPQGVNVITIETLIPSLAGATPEQIGVVLSLIDLDRSSFDQPPTLRLREEALQKMPAATLIKTFPSFSVRQLQELLAPNNSAYNSLYETLFKPFLQKSDDSNNFLLPIQEHLPLKDLAKFLATSKYPLQALLHSDKHTIQQPQLKPLGLVCALILSVCTLGIYPLIRYYLSPRNRFSWHLPSFMYTRKPPNRFHTTNIYPQAATFMRFSRSETTTKNGRVRPAPQSTKKGKPLRTAHTPRH